MTYLSTTGREYRGKPGRPFQREEPERDPEPKGDVGRNKLATLNRLWPKAVMGADPAQIVTLRALLNKVLVELQHDTRVAMIEEIETLSGRGCATLGYFPRVDRPVNLVVLHEDWARFRMKYGGRKAKVESEQYL